MTPGAKLKKQTQHPCTYKNKLILLSSHCENIFCVRLQVSLIQTEALLAFLQTKSSQLQLFIFTPTTKEKGLFTDIEVKIVSWTHDFSHLQTVVYSQPHCHLFSSNI